MSMLKKDYGNVMDLLRLGKIGMLILRKVHVKIALRKLSTRGCSQMLVQATSRADAPDNAHTWELKS